MLTKHRPAAKRQALAIAASSPVSWQAFTLHDAFDLSKEALKDLLRCEGAFYPSSGSSLSAHSFTFVPNF